jgi:hypothetical protein
MAFPFYDPLFMVHAGPGTYCLIFRIRLEQRMDCGGLSSAAVASECGWLQNIEMGCTMLLCLIVGECLALWW